MSTQQTVSAWDDPLTVQKEQTNSLSTHCPHNWMAEACKRPPPLHCSSKWWIGPRWSRSSAFCHPCPLRYGPQQPPSHATRLLLLLPSTGISNYRQFTATLLIRPSRTIVQRLLYHGPSLHRFAVSNSLVLLPRFNRTPSIHILHVA